MNLHEAARYLGRSLEATREGAARGQIPGTKDGYRWQFDPAELDAYIESCRIPARAELDAETRGMGFDGFEGCPHHACPSPFMCSERGTCPDEPPAGARMEP